MSGKQRPAPHDALVLTDSDTLRTAFQKLVGAFAAAGIESPETDARFLVQGLTGTVAEELIKTPGRLLGAAAPGIADAARRRLAHEPVSRILGERCFYGRTFEVTPDVLDPRPDTETIIEAVLQLADRKGWRARPIRIADIGTGSGSIIVTLLKELPMAEGIATDISEAALAVALRNARRHGVAARLACVCARSLGPAPLQFDLVVSNPPYIPAGEIASLPPEVRDYDPRLALDGGANGLSVYREIAGQIMALRASTSIVLELGAGQGDAVADLFKKAAPAGAKTVSSLRRDLGGHDRCVTIEIEF